MSEHGQFGKRFNFVDVYNISRHVKFYHQPLTVCWYPVYFRSPNTVFCLRRKSNCLRAISARHAALLSDGLTHRSLKSAIACSHASLGGARWSVGLNTIYNAMKYQRPIKITATHTVLIVSTTTMLGPRSPPRASLAVSTMRPWVVCSGIRYP